MHAESFNALFGTSLIRVEPRPAATVILMREINDRHGFEILMLKRSTELNFSAGAYVFPGGAVDPDDIQLASRCLGINDAEASKNLELDEGGIASYVAAIRECYEEAGIMLVRPRDDGSSGLGSRHLDLRSNQVKEKYTELRRLMNEGMVKFKDIVNSNDLVLTAADLHYVSHWVTPPGGSRRYDTRFFVARVPESQDVLHDEGEIVDSLWLKPSDALRRFEEGELRIIFPTLRNLSAIAKFNTTEEVFNWASGLTNIPTLSPIRVYENREAKFVLPGEELKRS
ncbi:MAG: NUDIX domain-containing protein [Acidimicrobiaceae bacterium]|nr:NUDIX domain-containing protein [Acidimicrobiaceae bacterium]